MPHQDVVVRWSPTAEMKSGAHEWTPDAHTATTSRDALFLPRQISSGHIWIAPDGHSDTHSPQPLQ
jgi:hypothetical protein